MDFLDDMNYGNTVNHTESTQELVATKNRTGRPCGDQQFLCMLAEVISTTIL